MASVSPPPYTQWLKWPGDDWERITPKQAGLDEAGFAAALAATPVEAAGWGGTAPAPHEYGAALTRGGYLVHTWGDPEFKTPSASLGKCMTRALVGITAEVFDEQPYTYSVLTLNGAQALLVNERGHGLVTVNAAGQGRVIVGAADYWMTDRLTYAAPELVNMEPPYTLLKGVRAVLGEYFGSFSPVSCEPGGLNVRVNCFANDPKRLLVNLTNNELFADWAGTVTVRLGEVAQARELWLNEPVEVSERNLSLSVPAGDVAVVDVRLK